MTPQPMPVPTLTTRTSCTDPATPISPSAMTLTSLSTKTGQRYRAKASGMGWSCQPGDLREHRPRALSDVDLVPGGGQDLGRQVGHRDVDAGDAEVDGEDTP